MNIAKYNSICRICLNESSDMNRIFGNTDSNNISNILITLADIEVVFQYEETAIVKYN